MFSDGGVSVLNRWHYENCISFKSPLTFLKQATDGAIAQNRLGFQSMLDDSTRNLQENVLGGIRSNSILSGQYGGSRQGIAEGRAIGDTMREQARAAAQFGQNATNASVGAQAQAYESDSNRALSATQGLGAQQYGVAQQNSAQAQQAAMANAAAANAASQTNYQGQLSGAMANAGFGQQAALANQGANLTQSGTNANLQQQANQTNYQGLLGVNAGNAALAQQANMGNQNAGNAASMFNATQQQTASSQNATLGQQNSQFNAGLLSDASRFNAGQNQSASQYNTGLLQQNSQFNAGLTQGANANNQQAQLGTNSLNSANQATGIGAAGGLLSQTLAGAQNQDNYALQRAGQVDGLLSGYLTQRPNQPAAQPYSSNTAGNFLGGAATGLALYNEFNKLGKPAAQTGSATPAPRSN